MFISINVLLDMNVNRLTFFKSLFILFNSYRTRER